MDLDDNTIKTKDAEAVGGRSPSSFGSTLWTKIRTYFLTGIVVTAPVAITLYLTYIFLAFIDQNVARILPGNMYDPFFGRPGIPGIGIIFAILFFMAIGWFATNFFGKFFIRLYESVLDRMPIIRSLYGGTKQVFETVMAAQSKAFREVVMLEYPRTGVWSIGFVTGVTEGQVQRVTKEDTMNIFVPTTPNPTSGYLLFVPKKELIYLDMTVEEGVKLVVSAGIIAPPDPRYVEPERIEDIPDNKKDKRSKAAKRRAQSEGK